MSFVLLFLLFDPLLLIVAIEVTILAHAFCIQELFGMWALGRKTVPTIEMVAVIAHALGVMLHRGMGTSGDHLLLLGLHHHHFVIIGLIWIPSHDFLNTKDWLNSPFSLGNSLEVQVV